MSDADQHKAAADNQTGHDPRPAAVPEKFWDAETQSVRVDALAKSYCELERHLGGSVKVPEPDANPADIEKFRRALGVPEAADGYELSLGEDGLEPDPEINKRLHDAGFTPAQAQLVYDLAAEYVAPMVQQAAADYEADRQTAKLEQHFGGAESWSEISRQIGEWGKANMAPAALASLSSTYEGCLALHKMMQSQEPKLSRTGAPEPGSGADDLKAMMRDPRYWRDRDPSFIRQVTDGFARVYRQPDA